MNRSLAAMLAVTAAGLGLAAPAPPRGDCGPAYRVVRGDTLFAIARRCGSSVAAIARASRLADPDLIRVGQRLAIPGAGPAQAGRRPPRRPAASYAMARGDTLFSLARWARVSLASLLAANPGIDPRRIEVGERIRLPGEASDPTAARRRERGAAPPPAPAPAAPRPEPAPAAPRLEPAPATLPGPPDEPREPVGM